jgi:hypothetical protein
VLVGGKRRGVGERSGGKVGLDWRTTIVDLSKLLDLDSSLDARKVPAQDLAVHTTPDGSAERNISLQKSVWKKLAENGTKVPERGGIE